MTFFASFLTKTAKKIQVSKKKKKKLKNDNRHVKISPYVKIYQDTAKRQISHKKQYMPLLCESLPL